MIGLQESIFSIMVMAEFVLGNFANGFIALVNCIDWVKRQKISSADRILTALAISRMGLLWAILIYWYATVLNPDLHRLEVRVIHVVWAIANHFSLWFAASLSIFYLLKIANFSNLIFLHLKWRVESVVLLMLFSTLVFLPFPIALANIDYNMRMNEYERNMTWKTKLKDITRLSTVPVFILAVFIPFATSLISFLLFVLSLWKHLKKMQLNGKGSQDPSTKIHIKALQNVFSFILLFAIYFVSLVISSMVQKELVLMLCQAIGTLYPSSHSFILILGNMKLRQAFLSLPRLLRCWLKEKETLTPKISTRGI
ncbi:taste receptor type 2 member 30-like [Dasypus novemcinctus]|uniref:taste receptor type 2 member 30-like n=1 Tax=Dasypus novemcinctus TaxID=9361 RepID=UPI000328FC43